MRIQIFAASMVFFILFSCGKTTRQETIDRFALVSRHNIQVNAFNPLASLTVGNGNFAFTTDITGLQTFYKEYEEGVSLGTMSNWGWHTIPNTENYNIAETYLYHEVEGRQVPYEHQLNTSPRALEAVSYYRENPHRLHLGIIRLVIIKENGEEITLNDVVNPDHQLDLWRGEVSSRFEVEGQPVELTVFAHQQLDLVSAKIESPLIAAGRLSVEWLFPYGMPVHSHAGYDFDAPDKHTSEIIHTGTNSVTISRTLDKDSYFTRVGWSEGADFKETEKHRFILEPAVNSQTLEFSCLFTPDSPDMELPAFEETQNNNEHHWEEFWMSGGAVDFSDCTDPRAHELERRVVLSQYLTKVNGSGNLPPQETGLTFNSWFGKFHLEMIWWHSAHFYNWQRPQYMAGQLAYYRDIYQKASGFTQLQGYEGVRWPKMVGPEGQNSPSSIGSYLIWQQPHLIYLAEQLYKADPTQKVLEEYADLIFATADFMADFPLFDEATGKYNLAPPLIPAQEHWDRLSTMNPPFELAYWHWGLSVAQQWKIRLGQPIETKWEEVRNNLPAPVAIDGLYMGIANAPDSYTNPLNMRDHPMVLGTLGMLPLWDNVDTATMRNTLKLAMERWDWPHTWGWDYPMVAMCATRLLEPEIALEALLKDVQKNTYLLNGHNYQDERLRIYLPGNGGLLKAVALMCAGWEGCELKNPGFPNVGKWNVKWENLNQDF
jgi:hypothetical protein